MEFSNFLKLKKILNKRILILGETGSGKTRLTIEIVKFLCSHGYSKDITIIDMAPERMHGIGGRIKDFLTKPLPVRYLTPPNIYPPRTLGKNREEVIKYAYLNYMALKPIIAQFIKNSTRILVVNDLTIYLHAGPLEDILECFKCSETVIANAYYGTRLIDDHGSGISKREKELVKAIFTCMDWVVLLSKEGIKLLKSAESEGNAKQR
ncbi:MAG: hypothetical protein DRJ38_02845 [Thermoprotei archaeon]|nr:MAG: hypothetical protein DRJ38_02845 [Thermoprotei archaeon]